MAKVWNLPALYICENNRFGMGTAVERVSSTHDFAVMATAYDLPGYTVEGMDVLAVYETIKKVADEARKTGTAALLDVKTYRYKGHSMSDPAKYRTKEQLEDFKRQDPILLLRTNMTDAGMLTEDEYKEMDSGIKAEVNEAVEFAESSEEPPLDTMYEDIYA
jgi:pyruvate dehydrogenase E1 component alpha subunit